MDQILVELQQSLIEIEGEPTLVVIEETGVEIIEIAEQGPPGPPGESGEGAYAWSTEEFVITTPQSLFTLTDEPRPGSATVFINGIAEKQSFYTLISTTLTLSESLDSRFGVAVKYQYLV